MKLRYRCLVGEDDIAGFIRQRRNVFLGSALIAFAEFADVTVSKINVFGTELVIRNPQTVNVVLWIVATYWMWRYYQYYRALDGKRGIWDAMWARLQLAILKPSALEQLKRTVPGLKDSKSGIADPVVTYNVGPPDISNRGPLFLGLVPSSLKLSVDVEKHEQSKDGKKAVSDGGRRFGVDFGLLELIVPYVRAFLYVTLHTPKVTDYLLPFAVFSVPVIYKVYEIAWAIWT